MVKALVFGAGIAGSSPAFPVSFGTFDTIRVPFLFPFRIISLLLSDCNANERKIPKSGCFMASVLQSVRFR